MTEPTASDFQALNPRLQGEIAVVTKAWKDESFKQALLANPKAILEQEFEMELPADLAVRVVEAQPDRFYLRLPLKPESVDAMSIEDLTQALSQTEGEAIAPIIAKAWKDEAFKQSLLSDPKAILTQEFGAELPENLTIEALEENANTMVMVLPLKPDSLEGELSDEDLESVAGGTASVLASIGKAVFPFAIRASTTAAQTGAKVVAASVATVVASAAGGTAVANKSWSFW